VFIHLNNNSVTTLFVILTVQNTGCIFVLLLTLQYISDISD